MDINDPKTAKLIFLALGIGALFYVNFFTTLLPISYKAQADELSELKSHYETLSLEVNRARQSAKNLPHLEAELDALEEKWNEANQLLPTEKQIIDLFREIYFRGISCGVDFTRFHPAGARAGEFYTENLLEIRVEGDYHRRVHSETRQTPIDRFLEGPDVLRPAPDPSVLKEAFRRHVRRRIRRSDSTLTVAGVRCDVPSAYRHLDRVRVAYARWDLGFIHLVDPNSGKPLVRIFPTDKSRNASGERRLLDPLAPEEEPRRPAGELPPFLKRLVEEYAASGLPPAYLSKQERDKLNDDDRDQNKGKEQP